MAVRRPMIDPNNFPRSGPFGAIGPKRPTGGMDCPALNEEVLLADNKWIPAKDLKIGDEVATHLGSNKVTHIDVLKDRITKRGNINEQFLTLEYLERLNDAYSRFFLYYEDSPLLIINAADINLESNDSDYESLITKIMSNPKGKTFINPQPSII